MTNSTTEKDRNTLLRESYTVATQRLREAHLEEFNAFRQEEAKARGVDWTPRPTADQKARAELERLLAENPTLIDELAERVKPTPQVNQ